MGPGPVPEEDVRLWGFGEGPGGIWRLKGGRKPLTALERGLRWVYLRSERGWAAGSGRPSEGLSSCRRGRTWGFWVSMAPRQKLLGLPTAAPSRRWWRL